MPPSSSSHCCAAALLNSTELSASTMSNPASASSGFASSAVSRTARRRPSASRLDSDARSFVSAGANARPVSRSKEIPPHVSSSTISAARSSSPSPLGPRTSRWRRLRSRSPPVASLKLAAGSAARARSTNLLTSGSAISISAMRGRACSGRPFWTTSPVGSSVAGSNVSTHTPSNATAPRSAFAAASAKSWTSNPRCASRTISARARVRGLAPTRPL